MHDAIITRNCGDFNAAQIEVYEPQEFLDRLTGLSALSFYIQTKKDSGGRTGGSAAASRSPLF